MAAAWWQDIESETSRSTSFWPIDAALGIEGLPQSATGQTALFTGVNALQLVGMHISAFPTQDLRDTIAEHSFLKRAHEAGYHVTFAQRLQFRLLGIPSPAP